MVEQMTAQQVQQMAQRLLDAKRCIEVTMLSGTTKKAMFHIDDMHCKKCATRIRTRLLRHQAIDTMEDDILQHNITVSFDGDQITADSIRAIITKVGYTPVSACKCGKGAYAYLIIPAEQATAESISKAKAIAGVEDANVSKLRKALAVKYHHKEISEQQLITALQQAGLQVSLPKPHVCSEESKNPAPTLQ